MDWMRHASDSECEYDIFRIRMWNYAMAWLGVLWTCASIGTFMAIVLDMRFLGLNRVGTSRLYWLLVCTGVGPVSGLFYLLFRRTTRARLLNTVSTFVGNDTSPIGVQEQRLSLLHAAGILSDAIHSQCCAELRGQGAPHCKSMSARKPSDLEPDAKTE